MHKALIRLEPGVEKLNTARVRLSELEVSEERYSKQAYVNNPIREENQVIEGYFQKEISQKAMAIRKVIKLYALYSVLRCLLHS